MEPILVIHGGAGSKIRNPEGREKDLGESLESGFCELKNGENSIIAAIKSVKVMEDSPFFNAGTGSVPNLMGEVEMDASIMKSDGTFGAVASIKNVKNPVDVAYQVATETEHLMLAGEGAALFARKYGHKEYNPLTKKMKELFNKRKDSSYYRELEKMRKLYSCDTVGAVAIDSFGNMATALSTGGIMFHLPGRVGDTPIIGGGIYASKRGAIAATGHGEGIMKYMVAKRADDLLEEMNAEDAARNVIEEIDADFGIIIVDRDGKVGISYNTKYMSWGIKTKKIKKVNSA